MKKLNKLVLGIAAAGVLLLGVASTPVGATALRTLVLTVLTATTGTITTLTAPTTTVATRLRGPSPATQVLAAGFTITADACGGTKLVSAAATVTSDTTNTLTAAATAGVCEMLVINTGTNEILLDFNTEFLVGAGSAASLRLAKGGSILVYSDGTSWYHGAYTEY